MRQRFIIDVDQVDVLVSAGQFHEVEIIAITGAQQTE